MRSEGVLCLANDGIIDGLIALCESLHAHSAATALTVIPFDDNLERTRRVLARFGYDLYEDPSLQAMDALGAAYWPGETFRPHTMRKLCAFWGPYERFLFLDADIVVLCSLEPYFEAFRRDHAQLMYFATDIAMVYKGGTLERMMAEHGAVGFQTGVFMGRRGALTEAALQGALASSRELREGFVDVLEQTFLNYAVDTAGLVKLDAHEAVPGLVDAWAALRLVRRRGELILSDARTPRESGRPVSLIHWAGFALGPLMPYRRLFLRYRLARATRAQRLRYRLEAGRRAIRRPTRRTPGLLRAHLRIRARNWLTARGHSARFI